MRLDNRIIVAAAGGGKTTRIVLEALSEPCLRTAIVTYTNNNKREIESKLYEQNRCIPPSVEIWPWLTFLIRELARPYQTIVPGFGAAVDECGIGGIAYVRSRSAMLVPKANVRKYYFTETSGRRLIYSDKISEFICKANDCTGGLVIKRLEERFDKIYIDEVQDMAGYDLDLIELFLRSRIKVVLVGDHRQATYRTHNSPRNKAFVGAKIVDKFRVWTRLGIADLSYADTTYRFNQNIADFADKFFPNETPTRSTNDLKTGHDGVFLVGANDVSDYMEKFWPQVLRLNKATNCKSYNALNFGESKGLSFDRVLIFPHKKGVDWLLSGDFSLVAGVREELYVGVTRARYSVAFVIDGESRLSGISRANVSELH